jgi:hypothetical protein
MNPCLKWSLIIVYLFLQACNVSQDTTRVQVPRGYTAVLRISENGRQMHLGPFVGYYFKPRDPGDLKRLDFVCFNERSFYTKDLPQNAMLYEGQAVLTVLPKVIPLPEYKGERICPVFESRIPQAWLVTRPAPQEEFIHFHSCYDASGPVYTGYWLRHQAATSFTYDMGGRVGPESALFHRAVPGPDHNFPQIVEFDFGPSK